LLQLPTKLIKKYEKSQPNGAMAPPCFYGTDAAHFKHLAGMEGVVCGPGGKFNTMPDERVELKDYLDSVRIYILLIIDICGLKN
jgi:Acetylornithine deacetylase/Succinyl-diaminopimelate desuccinylase and related deacylases